MDWPRDWKKAYRKLSEEHERLRESLRFYKDMLKQVSSYVEDAQPGSDLIVRLNEDIALQNEALEVLCHLHEREYRDGTIWCRECLYQWPCRTLQVINEVYKQFGAIHKQMW